MLILSHRGSDWQSGEIKENSIEAFQRSLDKGVDGIETDVRLDKNRRIVIKHDPVLNDEPNLLLEEFLEWAPSDILLNLEIKDPRVVNPLVNMVNKYNSKQYLISSSHHRAAWKFNKKMPDIECGVLISCFPLLFTIFEQMIPASFSHIIWEYEMYDSYLASKLDKYEHFLYNVPHNNAHKLVDGIISDHI